LALGAAMAPNDSTAKKGFEYGWVRGAGSAAFIAGAVVAGQVAGAAGLPAILWLSAALLAASGLSALLVPELTPRADHPVAGEQAAKDGIGTLLRLKRFRRLVIVAALVLGSHAMHDSFAVIRWNAAGIAPATVSVLWSEAVAAEVVVFLLIGPSLVTRLTPAGAMALAAAAGALRWAVMAQSTDVVALATVQPLHGISFALLHLAAMRIIGAIVPRDLAATAQAIYGTVGIGAATALLILASGWLYAGLGAQGFLVMAGLCVVALPVTWSLRGGIP
jgi:PPP family 3-phenylpropionic acid transporter